MIAVSRDAKAERVTSLLADAGLVIRGPKVTRSAFASRLTAIAI
jgi:hypothetical protein